MRQQSLDDLKRSPAQLLTLLRDCNLQQFGGSWRARCPVHQGERLSFSIFRNRRGEYLWQCHACGEHGDVVDLVRLLDNCDFKTAVATLRGPEAGRRVSAWRPSLAKKRGPTRTRVEVAIPCEAEGCSAVLRANLDEMPTLVEGHPAWDFDTRGVFHVWAWCPTHHRERQAA